MKIYLVGGAIRNKLLNIPVQEKDWVVVGSTPDEMKSKGFKQVGKDFPVFIHPKTGEEYALARTERKSGHGYTGFEFDSNPNVTLEEDLERRDLTINAIAQDEDGTLIDPFNGQEDIKNKKLRHVSEAFSEDPLRVLRVARFKSNLGLFNFLVVPETMNKLRDIVKSGELEYLTPERKWLEFYKTVIKHEFFDFLEEINANEIIAPEYSSNNCFLEDDSEFVFSSNIAIDGFFIANTMSDIDSFCKRFKVPNEYKDVAQLLRNCFKEYISYFPKDPNKYDGLLSLIKKLDIRKEERLRRFMAICQFWSVTPPDFFDEVISQIKSYKLNEQDQKKSNREIQNIIENAHREIAQNCIKNFLNKSN
ncbi:MAG: hypothetical protein CMD65_04645 [Gammaproteobacteria bacterium]|nr:hypothetical protein [Gammaproteobacteria bacterium]